ncbi:HAMP domain-containing protein [Qipengyuania sp. 6B39]|uniref:methyl-accepting chemotaxis protein n=1 Tax=Qipengyuania proteolytica TaxID=2867239 RepID=UPI001C89B704|nr:methyl-accepting chemotaxis protein [Qipengyuania proteolytica]MBX7495780.1 HAMP domain-containing protein [Qipengyuania proteolytica]
MSSNGTTTARFGSDSLLGWITRGSINRQFGVIFRTVGALVLLLGLAAALGFLRIEQRAQRLSELTEVAFLTSGMAREVTLSKDNMGAYRARGYDPEIIGLSIASAQRAQQMNADLRSSAAAIDPAWLSTIDELDTDLAKLEVTMEEVRDAPRGLVEQESFLGPRYDFIDTTNNKILGLGQDASTRVESVSTDGIGEIQAYIVAMVLLVILAVGLVVWAQHFVARRIVSPVAEISDVSARLAKGETDLMIPTYDREDEIGEMSRSLHVMQSYAMDSIEQAHRTIDAQAERDKRVAMVQSLADKFEAMIGQLAGDIAATSTQLNGAASLMNENAEKSSQRVVNATKLLGETSQGVTGAASASDEFVMSIGEISRQAANSADRAGKAREVATDANRSVRALDEMAGQVSAVVEMISQIAQRTNLLALNASIEAARGGEAGRGFAVVASEVKELAGQTARATEEVEEQIRRIQESSGSGAGALRRITEEVTELQGTATSIASAVDQQSVAGQDLARSIDMAARNTEAVAADMSEVSRMAVATGSAATQVLGSCQQLGEQAEALRRQVGEFLSHVRAA